MKRCLSCDGSFVGPDWECPACGFAPSSRDGVPCFAPALADENDGYPADVQMPSAEDAHFWRVARNRLFAWARRRYFPDARSFFEIGCGTGGILKALLDDSDLEVTGSEIYVRPLQDVQRDMPHAQVLQVDARRLPFRDEFDIVGAFDVIEHIDDDRGVVREMAAAARPGGGVMISVPQHQFLWSQRDVRLHHKRRYSRRELLAVVEDAGLEVRLCRSFMSLPFPAMALQALRNRRPREDYDPHAELKLGSVVNRSLGAVLTAERQLIKLGADFPVGGSLLVVASRPS